MRYLLGFLLIVFLGALLLFAVQNTDSMTVKFLDMRVTAPLALLAVAIYLLGMVSGWTVVAFLRRSFRQVTRPKD